MRVVFMGTPRFAVPSLRALAREMEVVAVYTRQDAVSGRGSRLRPSPVKETALELQLPVHQPRTLRDATEHETLRALAPDLIIVAAYGMILPREVLDIPRLGCINVHASLLPRWRGAAPIQRAILAGDETTGVAIMRMEEGLDTGDYCATADVSVGEKNAEQLTAELAEVGAKLLVAHLELLATGQCPWRPQEESRVTYAEKIAKSDVALSPELTLTELLRRVRASSSQAPARATIEGKGVTVIEARPSEAVAKPAAAVPTKTGILLGAADGTAEVTHIKPDGKPVMDAAAWSRGARLDDDSTWGPQ